jgi:hypothetical protein
MNPSVDRLIPFFVISAALFRRLRCRMRHATRIPVEYFLLQYGRSTRRQKETARMTGP